MTDARPGAPVGPAVPHLTGVWLGYLAFVVYGSLVPFDYRALPWHEAWATFQKLPMLQIGIQGRADWIANGVLYVPVGLLTLLQFRGGRQPPRGPWTIVAAAVFCLALDIAVEFVQLYFPQRTVSANDVVAEGIGSLLGMALGILGGRWHHEVLAATRGAWSSAPGRFLEAYGLGYVVLAFFPFDFVLSAAELAAKADSDAWGWFFAAQNLGRGAVILVAKLLAETVAVVPIGLLLGRFNEGRRAPATRLAFVIGLISGLVIETGQFFVYSGISQGASLLTRAVGMYLGSVAWRERARFRNRQAGRLKEPAAVLLGLVYLVVLAALNGWFDHRWRDIEAARQALAAVHFLPLYYHYFTTEQAALVSMLAVILMYAPLAALAWWQRRSSAVAGGLAAVCAATVEGGKLFLDGAHADPTNVLIALLSALGVARLLAYLPGAAAPSRPVDAVLKPVVSGPPPATVRGPSSRPSAKVTSILWLLAVAGLAAFWLGSFPVAPVAVGLGVAACGLLVWFKPEAGVALIPAALPMLDLAPWSGRFFLDEFDILLLVVVAVGHCRIGGSAGPGRKSFAAGWIRFWLGMLILSFVIGTVRALLPLPAIDGNSFNNYFSQFNALRIGKGLAWALLFAGFYRRLHVAGGPAFEWFGWGMVAGLTMTVLVIMREKALFGGLLNLDSEYRATGPFSAIHVGGAYIECYLAVSVPFLVAAAVRTRRWWLRVVGVAVLLATTYALMATVSRNGFAAFGVALVATALVLLGQPGRSRRSGILVVTLCAVSLAAAYPIFMGHFVQSRMAQVDKDLAVRLTHWQDALAMRRSDWAGELFGMGVGRYPETNFWNSRDVGHTSTYRLMTEGGQAFLRITPGSTLYVEQIVDVRPGRQYRLGFDLRTLAPGTNAGIALCEKWMLASARCADWHSTPADLAAGAWQAVSQTIDAGEVGEGIWPKRRPVKLSFFTNGTGTFDLGKVHLVDLASGQELVANGDFSKGLDRWFFSTDEHLAWHTKSLPIAILFDQGWFGLLAACVLVATLLVASVGAVRRGNADLGVVMASLLSFLVVGVFDTLIDSPRFLFLWMTLILLSDQALHHTIQPPRDASRRHLLDSGSQSS